MKREQETFPYIAKLLNGAEVEWKPLGEVAKVNKGVQLNKTKLKDEGKYPAYNGGKTYSGWTDDFNVEENTTIISQGGASAGFVNFVTTKFWANAHCYYIIPNLEIVNNRYLYQFLKFQEKFFMNSQHGAGIPALAISKLNKHLIPVPPLSVQQEIVRILDKFTQLEAELEAELDCRKRQYEYYRDMLLTSDEKQVEWKTLGEVAEVVTDFTAAGSFASNAKNVKYLKEPNYALLVRTTDLKKVFKNNEDFIYVDKHAFEYLWRVNLDKESIILPNVGNCGEVYYSIPQRLPYDNCVLGPNAILLRSCIVNNKYLYYLFQADDFQKDLSKITSTTGQTKFNKTNLKQIKIPIPPIEEQERIAGILDKFDTLVNSISEGLPREIELRRKQYEYYREKLLSFPTE